MRMARVDAKLVGRSLADNCVMRTACFAIVLGVGGRHHLQTDKLEHGIYLIGGVCARMRDAEAPLGGRTPHQLKLRPAGSLLVDGQE